MKNIKAKPFSALDIDKIVSNQDFSAETVRFIAMMRHLIVTKKDDFVITKKLVLESCFISERTYRKVMKEAKDYIKLTRKRVKSTWSYTYELLKETFTKTKKIEAIETENVIEDTLIVNNPTDLVLANEHIQEDTSADTDLDDKLTLVKACINPIHTISKNSISLLKKVRYYDLVNILEPIFTKNKLENNKVSIRYIENALKVFCNNNSW